EDQLDKWKSFKREVGDGKLVTVRSIFKLARKAGWKGWQTNPKEEFERIEPKMPTTSTENKKPRRRKPGQGQLMAQTALEKSIILLDPRDPMPSARRLIAYAFTYFDDGALLPCLHHVGGDFLVWRGTHYQRMTEDAPKADVWKFLEAAK